MASPVEAQVIICDAAQADPSSGKVHMLGAGWSMAPSPVPAHAVALLLKVPWDRTNQKLDMVLSLVDGDGQPVEIPGAPPIRHESKIEVGRPPGIAHGSMLNASFALSVPPLPLPPGRYEWHLDFAGSSFGASFQVIAS